MTAQADLPYLYYLVGTMNIAPGVPDGSVLQSWESILNPFLVQGVQQFYNVVTVPYPASFFDAGKSFHEGVANTVQLINEHPGKFVLGGASQGAAVVSQVFKMLQAGDGNINGNRLADCIFGVTFGNPARQAGHTFPGGTDPGGHGVRFSKYRMTNTPTLWWDFAAPGDIIASTFDDPVGQLTSAIFEFIWFDTDFSTTTASQAEIWGAVNSAVQEAFSSSGQSPAVIQQTLASLWAGLTWSIPHTSYTSYYAPLSGDPRTSSQLAIAQLASLAVSLGITPPSAPVGPITNEIPPQGVLVQIATLLSGMGLKYPADYRFSTAAALCGVLEMEWAPNPTQAGVDLQTLQMQLAAIQSSYPHDAKIAQMVEYAASLR